MQVPYEGAEDIRCKYVVKPGANLPGKSTGYIYLEIETYGFDEDVFVIIQPEGKYQNYVASSSSRSPQVLKGRFGSKFYIPADNDVLMLFAPVRNIGDQVGVVSQSGKFKMRTSFNATVDESVKSQADVVFISRTTSTPDTDIVPANTTANNTYPTNDFKEVKQNETDVKTNWEGEVIPKGPWYDKELFKIGD